jgi:hypothetical protein
MRAALVAAALLAAGCGSGGAIHVSTTAPSVPPSSATPVSTHPTTTTRAPARKRHPTTTTTSTSTTGLGVTQPTGTTPLPSPSCAVPPLQPPAAGLVVGRVTAVGDSVMIDLEPSLEADVKGIAFDAVVGQQWSDGIGEVQQLRSDGQLGSVVVIELGTNGPISAGLFDEMMAQLQGVSRVVFVTNYVPDSYETSNNDIIISGAAQYKNAAVANWYALAAANPGWLCPDGYHLSCGGPGAGELAGLIAKCV